MGERPGSASVGVWFRQDLRVHDHAALTAAIAASSVVGAQLLCVYCLDPREFGGTRLHGWPRSGCHRTRFLLEALRDLRQTLRRLGGELVIRRGEPEQVLPALAREHGVIAWHHHQLVGTEERAVASRVERALAQHGCRTYRHRDRTLVDLERLPFAVADTPQLFTRFRQLVERTGQYPGPLPAPEVLPPTPAGALRDVGELPELAELGVAPPIDDERAPLCFVGGETAGLARLEAWCWRDDCLRTYKQTRNGMLGRDYSSKLSPWLALGCVSARRIQAEVVRYEQERIANESTYWLTFELLWRDWFQLVALQHGAHLFRASGLQGIEVEWQHDDDASARWRTGTTGFPIVDANLRELAATGFLSNRGRQIVASFLTKNLGLDWRMGAEWFESRLVDHDVASNYGNWNYAAGVGNDARGFRYFDLEIQASKYDRDGEHARLWCPELAPIDGPTVHAPWTLSEAEQRRLGVRIGRDYPAPMVDLEASMRRQRDRWQSAMAASASGRASKGAAK